MVKRRAARSAITWIWVSVLVGLWAGQSTGNSPLASDRLRIVGLSIYVNPAAINGAPRNVPLLLDTHLKDSGGDEIGDGDLLSGLRVRGTLNGPGLTESVEIATIPGQPIEIGTGSDTPNVIPGPPLSVPGTYTIDNLRLTNAESETIIPATPSVVTITVVDKVLSYGLTSRPLSLEEIRDRGIVIDESNYTAYEFSFTVDTESGVVSVPFDVAFPQDDEELEGGGPFTFPPILPGLNVPNLNIEGILLEHEPLDYPIDIPPIPGVLVIPGNIAFLNQFANVAPPGSQLVVTSATAALLLSPGPDGTPGAVDGAT